jgi:hypothetical protein
MRWHEAGVAAGSTEVSASSVPHPFKVLSRDLLVWEVRVPRRDWLVCEATVLRFVTLDGFDAFGNRIRPLCERRGSHRGPRWSAQLDLAQNPSVFVGFERNTRCAPHPSTTSANEQVPRANAWAKVEGYRIIICRVARGWGSEISPRCSRVRRSIESTAHSVQLQTDVAREECLPAPGLTHALRGAIVAPCCTSR